MRIVNNNVESLPLDVIGMLMENLLAGGFEDAFNFFLAWAQTQRPLVILSFLEGFPLRALYKFAHVGSAADKSCFERFFGIAERLGVYDAVLYRRCREVLSGVGDTNGHLIVIDGLARHAHFTSMVASFALRNIYKKESIGRALHSLTGIFDHPEFKYGIVPVLANLESIYLATEHPVRGPQSSVSLTCHIHSAHNKALAQTEFMGGIDCFFCSLELMLKVFSREGASA